MSAWSDYRVTGDPADLETFRQECEADEKAYRDSLYNNVYDEDYEEDEE